MKKTCLLFLTAALLCAALSACGADVVPATAPPATLPPAATAAPETADNPAGETGAEPETPSETLPTDEPAAPSAEPTPEPAPEVTPEPTPEPVIPREQLDYTAAELTPMISLSVGSAGMDLSLMLDRNYETMVPFYGANMLRMDFESECSGVYVVWNTPPGEWKLWDRGETLLCGGNGFLHEYIELPVPNAMIEMILPQGGTICDFYAVGNGRLPAFIQNWQPPAEKADLLLFPTHGDDELLFFGGAMPYYAGELGMEVQVAYMTNHSNEMPRPHEQLNGLWTVGVTRYPVLSDNIDKMTSTLGDAEAMYGNSFKDFQVMMIRRFQPLVVVGHDVDGEYGHGSHRLAGLALLESPIISRSPWSGTGYGIRRSCTFTCTHKTPWR